MIQSEEKLNTNKNACSKVVFRSKALRLRQNYRLGWASMHWPFTSLLSGAIRYR